MVKYSDEVLKRVQKGFIPKEIFIHFNNAFISLDLTKDLNLFDIKQLKISEEKQRVYYRLRKEMYKNIVDRKVIDTFEKEKHTFVNAEDILREFVSPPLQLDNKDRL